MRKATRHDIENATAQLAKCIEKPLMLDFDGRKARVVRPYGDKGGISVSFGHTFYSYSVLYDMLWFAVECFRVTEEK